MYFRVSPLWLGHSCNNQLLEKSPGGIPSAQGFGRMPARDCQDQLELAGALTPLGEWFPECGLWINGLNITLDLDRNANLQDYPRPTETQQREFSNTSRSSYPWLGFPSSLFCSSEPHASIPWESLPKISPCLMPCVSGETHAKQHLFHQSQHTSLLSHGSQSSLQYPLA